MLKVDGIKEIRDEQCIVKFDEQVPISFRSRSSPLPGARHIRIGDFDKQLFDLQVAKDDLTICGFTFISGGHLSSALNRGEKIAHGLPIVRFDEGVEFADKGHISKIDINADICVAMTGARVEIYFGDDNTYDKSIKAGRVEFLVSKGYFIGVSVSDLSPREIAIFHEHFSADS